MVLNFPSSPAAGALHNASNGLAYAFDGVKWTSQGSFNTGTVNVLKLDSIASSFNGSLKTFNLKVNNITVKPVNDQAVLISVNNVVLEPTVAYSINVNTGQITFTTAPTGGHAFFGILYSRIPVIDSITNPIQLSNGDKGDITVTNAGAVNEAFTIDAGVISTDKIADDAVTADKLANSINSAIAANTAKISNATHTGDVTGSTSLSIANDAVITSKIADDAVTSAKIAPNAITSSHIAADTVIAADIAANAITASELADNAVDTAAIVDNAVTGAKIADNLDIPDSNKIRFGTGNDLEIFHSGSNAFITNTTGFTSLKSSNGILYLSGNNTHIRSGDDGETQAVFNDNGSVDLYYDNSKKLATSSTGIIVLGTAPSLKFEDSNHQDFTIAADANDLIISDANNGDRLKFNANGSITALGFFSNIGTVYGSTGLATNGNIIINDDNDKLQIGASQDLELYHDSINSIIANSTGNTYIKGLGTSGNTIILEPKNNENSAKFIPDGAVELYYDNSKKFETTATGNLFLGSIKGADNADLILGNSDDLKFYHDGTNSAIQNATGYLYLYGGTNNIYIRPKNDEDSIVAKPNESVELHFDNSKKFETLSDGVSITGTLKVGNNNSKFGQNFLRFEHNGTGFFDHNFTGQDLNFRTSISSSLDTTAFIIKSSGNIQIPSDSTKLQLGASQSLNIFYDGNSHIDNNNGSLKINTASGTVQINKGTTEHMAVFNVDGESSLYFDNSRKLQTTSAGITVTDVISITDSAGAQRLLMGNQDSAGANCPKILNSGNGILTIGIGDSWSGDGGTLTDQLKVLKDGNIQIPNDNAILQIGASQDLAIYHDGSNSHILDNGTGDLRFTTNGAKIDFQKSGGEVLARFITDGSVELYEDGTKRFETTSDGVNVTGTLKVNGSAISTGGLGNVVEDTTPQLGGDLQSNGNDIDFADNDKAIFGAGSDLQIFHDGNFSRIKDAGTGDLVLQSNTISFVNAADSETLAQFKENGSVDLYYDNSKKFETTSTGISVTGDINSTGTIKTTGNQITIEGVAPVLTFTETNDNPDYQISGNGGALTFKDTTNNAERLKIHSDGNIQIPSDSTKLQLGASQDLQLSHNGSSSVIENSTGYLFIHGNDIALRSPAQENYIVCDANAEVELYYDNSKKFETTSFGATVQGGITFGSDTAAANQLDDYEEGTWTPSLEFGGSSTGITYSSLRGGNYTKIGRQVTVNFAFTLTSKGSATGDAHISGLPFAVADLLSGTSLESSGVSAFWNNLTTNAANIVFGATESASKINVRFTIGAEDDTDDMQENDFANNTALRGSITYFTAS